jgi:triosephosphate isomerase
MLIVNFKGYRKGTGTEARETAKKCVEASEEFDSELIICPQAEDLLRLKDLDVSVYAQHVSNFKPGSHTGHPIAESLAEAGATGTLINHSERRILDGSIMKDTVRRAQENDMTAVLCAQSPEECEKLSKHEPDYIAFEPPELIGGDTAVSEAEPELIEEAAERSDTPLLAGAGIKDTEDVEKAIELGCEGVLVASGVVKSNDVEESVRELMSGL